MKGEYTKAAKRLTIGAVFATVASLDRTSMYKDAFKRAQSDLETCESDLAEAHKTTVNFGQDLTNQKVDTNALYKECRVELKTLQMKIEALTSRSLWDIIWNKPLEPTKEHSELTKSLRHIVFGTTYLEDNQMRDKLSQMVDKTHREYAQKWNLEHQVVTKSLLKNRCARSVQDSSEVDCVPYWNKIAVICDWLKQENTFGEEWRIIADDDMPVTNMNIDPTRAIDLLRRGKDTSVIVVRDIQVWTNDPKTAVNTGLLFVRKDAASRKFFDAIWERRNSQGTGHSHCRTLGTCHNQDTLHEQQAMASVLSEDKSLLDSVVTIVMPRDRYQGEEIALNTFERSGCFIRDQEGWDSRSYNFNTDDSYPEGAWRKGDWMGQTAGVPIQGWYCEDIYNGKPSGPIRENKLRSMIEKTIR